MPPRCICRVFVAAVVLVVFVSVPVEAAVKVAPASGADLRDLHLFDLDGHRHDLTEVKTQCVVLVFWAFWCDTWKTALPALTQIQKDGGVLDCQVWTVSVDGRWTEQIRPLVSARRVPFPALLDDGTVSRQLGIRRVPTVLLLDRRRKVVWLHEGYPGNAALEAAIRKLTR